VFARALVIVTPVARVVFALAAFAPQRDLVYVTVTLVVLSILAYSRGRAF